LRTKILQRYNASDKRLGVKKIKLRLKAEYGINISAGRVYRLMKSMQLPKMSTHKNYVSRSRKFYKTEENLLKQQFNTSAPNIAWVSDITDIQTDKGRCHLCVVIDLFSRKIISWSVSSNANAEFIADTVLRAWKVRGCPKSVIFHSDRGTQYTSTLFRRLLDEIGFIQSFSAPSCPYDNAVAEAFFKYLKKEEINRRSFLQIDDVKRALFHYIEGFYNSKRPHNANDGLSPNEKEIMFRNKSK